MYMYKTVLNTLVINAMKMFRIIYQITDFKKYYPSERIPLYMLGLGNIGHVCLYGCHQ